MISFVYGVMGSGKSLDLIARVYHEKSKDNNVWVWKPELDTRSNQISTRAGLTCGIDHIIPKDYVIAHHIYTKEKRPIFLFIDESQFLTKEQVDVLSNLSRTDDINIYCYGLKTDFQGNLFSGAKRLLEVADNIKEIETSCKHCENKAIYNMRVKNNVPCFDGKSIEIEGTDQTITYQPVCSYCYYKFKEKK